MICPYCKCPMELWVSDTDEYDNNPRIEIIDGEEIEIYEWSCPECEYTDTTYDG